GQNQRYYQHQKQCNQQSSSQTNTAAQKIKTKRQQISIQHRIKRSAKNHKRGHICHSENQPGRDQQRTDKQHRSSYAPSHQQQRCKNRHFQRQIKQIPPQQPVETVGYHKNRPQVEDGQQVQSPLCIFVVEYWNGHRAWHYCPCGAPV